MTELMYEELKKAIFDNGVEAIDDFLGYEHDVNEEKDTIERRMDEVLDQMPEEETLAFYNKYCKPSGQIVEIPWNDSMENVTTALYLDTEEQYSISELITLLESAKEKFGDKKVLIHEQNSGIIGGFFHIYLKKGFDEREKYGENYYEDDVICIYA